MPKTSSEGSIFPGLEQEQRSTPHPKRTSPAGKAESAADSNDAENGRKTEQIKADARPSLQRNLDFQINSFIAHLRSLGII